ncbi:MAG: hypothetical protein QOD80_2121 [Verrucomicrobiota bacterium]
MKDTKQFQGQQVRARLAHAAIFASMLAAATTASALTINLTFDPDQNLIAAGLTAADITAMKAACASAATQFTSRYTDPINVNIKVTASPGTSDLGSSTTPFDSVASYNNLRAAFTADSKTADDATTVGSGGSLVAGADPIGTAHEYNVARAQAKALGLRPDDMLNDGTFNFGGGQKWTYDPNNRNVAGKFDFIGVAMHEYSEIMGRTSVMGDTLGTGTPQYCAFDLFHYTAAGARGLSKGPGRFFSFNNGTSLLIAFNNNAANGGDLQDWAGPAPDSFNAAGPPGEQDDLSAVDLQTMDVIGYDRGASVPGVVGNASTRLPITSQDPLIEGFTVSGPAGSTKKIIVRAIGPSLTPFGVTDALPNPTLEVHDSNNNNAIVARNDNWQTTQTGGIITADQSAEINASAFKPGNSLESAIIANLAPSAYTAVVAGAPGSNPAGTAVVDAFDMSPASSAKLVNIATRGLVKPGNGLMTAGFITQNGPVKIVVLGTGPSLTPFGIPNALPDTTLQLRDQNGTVVIENDDWKVRSSDGSSQQGEIEATGLAPSNNLEAALVITIQPGQYTAQLRGKPESTGTGVVQVYFLP